MIIIIESTDTQNFEGVQTSRNWSLSINFMLLNDYKSVSPFYLNT